MIKSAIFGANLINMSPRSILLCIILCLYGLSLSAQYTEKINSNRPGTSQGAFSVGNNVLQFEGGIGYGKEKHKLRDTKTSTFNLDYTARYGLLIEQLEIRANGTYRRDVVKQTIGANEEKISLSNFEINNIGAKYLIYDPYKRPKKDSINLLSARAQKKFKWKTLIPAVSIFAGANFMTKENPFTFPNDPSFSPKFVIATQNNWQTSLAGNWVLVTNFIVDKITTDYPLFGWIITSTHTVNNKWAVFGEYQGQKSDFYSDNILRLGGAYLLNNDLQLDANVAFNFKDTPSVFKVSIGASYRFDWHTKDEIIEEPGTEKDKDKEKPEEDENGDEENLEEFEEIENDSLKLNRTPFINQFEDEEHRIDLENDLDERRTEERLERERIEDEKVAKKEDKKSQKEERKRLKREAKQAKKDEKARIKAKKEKQKMIDDIDAELNKMENDDGLDKELNEIEKELKLLEGSDQKEKKKKEKKKKEKKKKEVDEKLDTEDSIDNEFEEYEKQKEAEEEQQKEDEKRKKKEEKKRLKEEKKRKKEEEKRKKKEQDGE